jgi:hypothetical protein
MVGVVSPASGRKFSEIIAIQASREFPEFNTLKFKISQIIEPTGEGDVQSREAELNNLNWLRGALMVCMFATIILKSSKF